METNKDRRIKREIANSNERRRMQSINAGFHKLKSLLPVNDGEKISKANILQHAADFIINIERDRTMLHEQNTLLRQLLKDRTENNNNNNNNTGSNNNNKNNNCNNNTRSSLDDELNTNVLPNIPLNPRVAATPTAKNAGSGRRRNKKVAKITSDKPSSQGKNGLVGPSSIAKAAIALPLEVPYTTETIIGRSRSPADPASIGHHPDTEVVISSNNVSGNVTGQPTVAPRKVVKKETAALTICPLEQTATDTVPKGQNLDTICKAILEIEGDRAFPTTRQCLQNNANTAAATTANQMPFLESQ